MPTAARLLSAIYLAAVAYFVSQMVMAAMLAQEPALNFGRFLEINLAICAFLGWFMLGSRIGNPYSVATGLGLTAIAAAVFWCLFAHASIEMLRRALDSRYDGLMEALLGALEFGLNYGAELLRPQIILILLVAGIFGGLFAEFASRRWR
ncbi:TrgA family protein [uncultured Lentibacter sp.]|uniref:TrgA family protein n=1 Tax=uncultured Lentibacter sp. TaxID=1659309 RepID=UPI002638947C|nr:TrgA family protein [uncultured Lentibacter sp.]